MGYVPPAGEEEEGAATYKISGYVKDSDGSVLEGVKVVLDGKTQYTDTSGYYEFTGLEGNKSYSLATSKSGYEDHSTTVQLGTQDKQADDISVKTESVAAPQSAIKSAIATQYTVSTDNVEIYWWAQAAETDNWAAGAVVNEQKSVVVFYLESADGLTVENSYDAATGDEQTAMSTLAGKTVLSRYTSKRIVPFNIVKQDSTYTFDYYHGYDGILKKWRVGAAVMDENGDVPEDNMTDGWISASAMQ